MISIILVEPEWASNVGAVARVMGNFDFKELVLVNPRCSVKELDAVKRAKHAVSILKKSKIVNWKDLGMFDYLIATTSKLGSDYNIPRLPISPEQLSSKLSKIDLKKKKIGLVFGREGEGLHNDEIKKCDMIVTIDSSLKYPVLNLSHAVNIVLYELFKKLGNKREEFDLISGKEKNKLIGLINSVVDKLNFQTPDKKKNMKMLWKKLLGKSFLTKREAFGLFGFFRKVK